MSTEERLNKKMQELSEAVMSHWKHKPECPMNQCTCGGPYIVDKDGSLRTDYRTYHTPTPWSICGDRIIGSNGLLVATIADRVYSIRRANARVIHVAPDLLALCERILPFLDGNWQEMHDEANRIIARAMDRGEPQ